jgi:hypothetical protein
MDNETAVNYLDSLLGRTLRAHTTDGVSAYQTILLDQKLNFLHQRMFLGEFKCTDNVGQSLSY